MVSRSIGPAYTWSTYSPGIVDSGNCTPLSTVLTTTSRWLASAMIAPSVPSTSIQVVAWLG